MRLSDSACILNYVEFYYFIENVYEFSEEKKGEKKFGFAESHEQD